MVLRSAHLSSPNRRRSPRFACSTSHRGPCSIKSGFFDPFQVHLSFVFDELNVAGDWAFARGPFELRLTPKPGGEPVVDRGKFIDVFRRQGDGSWRFARVIFNRNRPAA